MTESLACLPSTYIGPVFSVAYANEDYDFSSRQGEDVLRRLSHEGRLQSGDYEFCKKEIEEKLKSYSGYSFYRERYLVGVSEVEVQNLQIMGKNVSLNLLQHVCPKTTQQTYVSPLLSTRSLNKRRKLSPPA